MKVQLRPLFVKNNAITVFATQKPAKNTDYISIGLIAHYFLNVEALFKTTCATFTRLAQNSHEFCEANVIFQKGGLANVYILVSITLGHCESGKSQHIPFMDHFVLPRLAKFSKFATLTKP
jgi:hypothetical protein